MELLLTHQRQGGLTMSFCNQGRFRQQVRFLQRQFLQGGDLPFTDVLTERSVTQALKALNVVWLDRVYSPLVTLWVFLGQVLSRDHSCRAAVARLIAHRISRGERACSAETGAYCQARKRLPEEFFAAVARKTGQVLDEGAHQGWLWKGRRVLVYDGSTVSMPDTAENQQVYPQPPQQQPGLGFPLARIAAFFSLSCGAVIDLAISPYAGKDNSEMGMLRKLWEVLRPGDIMLADRYMCAWHEIYLLKQRGIDTVTRVHHCRRVDFRRGKRLGKDDHIVEWHRPGRIRSIDWQTLKLLPEQLTIRETHVRIQQPGFRCRSMIVVSTLLMLRRSQPATWQDSTVPAGMPNSICAHSNKRCRWTSCVARRQSWCGRKSGHTSSLTISFAPSLRRLPTSTISNRVPSASREQFKRWKRFSH
jgi:hypothetical protein